MNEARATWIRAAQLRHRWGDMAASTFYDRLKKGRIPPAQYPFGPDTPYWRLEVIEAHEAKALQVAA